MDSFFTPETNPDLIRKFGGDFPPCIIIPYPPLICAMKPSRSRIALLAFLCGTSLLHADILILKSGTKVEGNILSESPTAIRMKYRLTPKIWDEKDFSRDEIQQVIKQSPQEVELIELKKILPTPDLLPADKYEQVIQDRVRPFINKYQGTPESKEAEGIAATLQEEKKRVSNGEVKLGGRWLNAAEARGEQYNIEAFKIQKEMQEQMSKNEFIDALRTFDKFTRVRPGYTASTYYPQSITDALTCLDKLETTLSKMAQEQPSLQKARDEGLKKLDDDDKAKTRAAIDGEKNKWRAEAEAQRRANVRWMEPYKYDLPSILAAQKVIVGERTRLQAINLEELKVRNEAFVAVYRKIGEGDYAGGAAAFERVQPFASVNEYRDVVADLKAKLLKLYGELVRKNNSGQMATSGSAALGTGTASSVDDRVARILAENNGTAAPAATGAPATAAAPAGTAPAPVTAPAPAPAVRPPVQQQPVVQAPQPPVAQAPAYVPPAEESNFQTYVIIGMAVLLVLFGVMAFKKKKAE